MAGKYNKHKQDGSHLGFPITMIFAFSVQEKKFKTDFQDGRYSRNLGFHIATICAIFDLQVTSMLPTKFQVNWPFSSEEEEGKNRF